MNESRVEALVAVMDATNDDTALAERLGEFDPADFHGVSADGRQPLVELARRGGDALLRRVVELGVSLDIQPNGVPLACQCDFAGLRFIVDHVGQEHLDRALFEFLVWPGKTLEDLRALLDAGANPSAKSEDGGYTPLTLLPVFDCNMSHAELLIEYGADINAPDSDRGAPLCSAIDCGPEFVELLLRAGAEPDPVSIDDGRTPLQTVASDYPDEAGTEILRLLVEHGADLHRKDIDGMSAADFLREAHRESAKRLELFDLDADPAT